MYGSASGEDSLNPEEVLVGAELYLYLLNENKRQIDAAQRKRDEYQALQANLLDLVKRPRRKVMAPVADGLAYFDATLNATNSILVLLGDSWFAERSASQAAEIASRRVDFLNRELRVLQEERRSYESRQDMFLSEMPDAEEAMMAILATKERGMEEAHTIGLPNVSSSSHALSVPDPRESAAARSVAIPPPSAVHSAATASTEVTVTAASEQAQGPTTPSRSSSSTQRATENPSSRAPPPPSSPPPVSDPCQPAPAASAAPSLADQGLGDDLVSLAQRCGVSAEELKQLSILGEEDDLTEDELMALEKELGDRVDDDDYVEQVMMARIVAKKETKLRAELERRLADGAEAEAHDAAVPQAAPPAAAAGAVADASTCSFRSPADIGCALSMTPEPSLHTEVETAPVHAHSETANQCGTTREAAPKDKKRVTFSDALDVRGQTASSPSAPPPSAPSYSLGTEGRARVALGDIVEHGVSALPTDTQPTNPNKRRSLFMRNLDGDN